MMIAMHTNTAKTYPAIKSNLYPRINVDTLTSAAINHSKNFTGLPLSGSPNARINSTSHHVNNTPAHKGNLGIIMQRAIADPSSSARSVLMMAISASA